MSTLINQKIRQESNLGALPLTEKERLWGFSDFFWVNISLAIATWAFLSGGATALMVGFSEGFSAMLIGNTIGGAIMLLGGPLMTQRYGVEHFTLLRSVLGKTGVAMMVFVVVLIIGVGWHSILSLMVGRAFVQVSNQAFATVYDINGSLVSVLAIIALFISWLIVSRGPVLIGRLNAYVAPGLVGITLVMIVILLTHTTWNALLEAPALSPLSNPQLSFVMAIEFNVGAAIAWWQTIGSFARLTKTPQAGLWGAYIGLLFGTMLAGVTGLAAALTVGESDPPSWMVPLGGTVAGVLALAFIAFANITSVASASYPTILAIKQAAGKLLQEKSWSWITAGYIFLCMLCSLFPVFMVEKFQIFVTLSGGVLAAICGIIAADYFILRKQVIEIPELFKEVGQGAYDFHRGVNIGGLLALFCGVIVFMWLYNPITLETHWLFVLISASIPATVIAGIVHTVACHILYRCRGKGGYYGIDIFIDKLKLDNQLGAENE